ncbi:hypothetical protein HDV06_000877 [Boothiomyces sp. JEL0866]|nr:hypothetical protein HDV06_000877 [Boothiomyces sp. JEL0866]
MIAAEKETEQQPVKNALKNAANSQYHSRPEGCFKKLVAFYKPTYPDAKKGLNPDQLVKYKRYWGGRMKPFEFVLLHIFILINFFTIVLSPIFYFYIIPKYVQYIVDGIGTGSNPPILLRNFNVGKFSNDSLGIGVSLGIDPILPFPINGGIGATHVTVVDEQDNKIAELDIPELDFWINREVDIAMNTTVQMNTDSQNNLKKMLNRMSSGSGISDLTFTIHFNAPIKAFGIPVYAGLPLHKVLNLGDLQASLASFGRFIGRTENAVSPESFRATGADLREHFAADDILSITKTFGVVWSKLGITMNDQGAQIDMGLSFENGTPLTVTLIEGIQLYLSLQDVPIMKISIDKVGLVDGLQNLELEIGILLLDDKISASNFGIALELASKSYVDTGDFSISVAGPIDIHNGDFVHFITQDFKFIIKFSDLWNIITSITGPIDLSSLTSVQGILENAQVQSILGNSSIALDVLSDKIQIPLGLVLPNFLPIPRQINFPYFTTVSIVGQTSQLIQSNVDPVYISRNDKNIQANTTINVIPNNTDTAATELAQAINPILAANPTSSIIGISRLAFFTDNLQHFKWCDEIFGSRVISIHLPAIPKEKIINSLLDAPDLGISKAISNLVTVNKFNIAQMNDQPGFGVDGNVNINYPPGLPLLKIDFGFFNIDATVESADFASLQLPAGLQFAPSSSGTTLGASAIVSRNPQVPQKAQSFVDSFVKDAAPPSYMGVTGLKFGANPQAAFVTFSKVNIDLSTGTILNITESVGFNNAVSKLISDVLVKVTGADLSVNSGSKVSVVANTLFANPTVANINVGSISVDLSGNEFVLGTTVINPLSIKAGSSPLDANLGVSLAQGSPGMDQAVASIVNSVFSTNPSSDVIGIQGVKLIPVQQTSPSSIIDQFSLVKVEVALNKLKSFISNLQTAKSKLLDISAVIPPTGFVDTINLSFLYASAAAKQNQVMAVGANISYTNILPISAKIPYAGATVSIDNLPTFIVQITGIQVDRKSGALSPRLNVQFGKDQKVPASLATFVQNFLNGQIPQSVSIGQIFFGTSPDDQNGLLSTTMVNVNPYLSNIASYGAKIGKALSGVVISELQKRDGLFSLDLFGEIKFALDQVDLSILPNKIIGVNIGSTLGLPFPVELNLPYVAVSLSIDKELFANVNLGLGLSAGNSALSLKPVVNINDSDNVAQNIASVVSDIVNGNTVTSDFGINQISFGASQSDTITAFSLLNVVVPIEKLMSAAGGSLKIPSFKDFVNNYGISLGSLSVKAKPQRSVDLGTSLKFHNNFPVSLSGLNYITASAGIDDVKVVSVGLPGISLSPGSNLFNASISASFPSSAAIQQKVATFVSNVNNNLGHTSENLAVAGITFGFSQSEQFKFLSQAKFEIGSSAVINQNTVSDLTSLVQQKINLNLGDIVSLKSLNAEFTKDKRIIASVGGSTSLNFPISIDLPYMILDASVDQVDGFYVGVTDLHLQGTGPLSISSTVTSPDTDSLAFKIASIVNAVENGNPLPGLIGGGKLIFGMDSNDNIDTFNQVMVNLNLENAARPIINNFPSVDIKEIFHGLGLKISEAGVAAKPNKVLTASASLSLTNNFQLGVKGLNYVFTGVGINTVEILEFYSPSFASISPGNQSLKVDMELHFPSSDIIKSTFGKFATDLTENFGKTTEMISLSNLAFGFDEGSKFNFLSRSMIGAKSSAILNQNTLDAALDIASTMGFNLSQIIDQVQVEDLDASFIENSNINAAIGANILMPFEIALDMPYFTSGIALDSMDLLNVAVTGVKVNGKGQNNLALKSLVKFYDSEDLENQIRDVVNAILDKADIPGTIGVRGPLFGYDDSPANVIDTFQELDAHVLLEKFADLFVPTWKSGTVPSISNFLNKLNLELHKLLVQTLPKKNMGALIQGSFDIPLNFSLSGFGYFGVQIGLDDLPMIGVVGPKGLSIAHPHNDLDLETVINFPSALAIQDKAAAFASDLIQNGLSNVKETLLIKELVFGHDQSSAIKVLSKVTLNISPKAIFNQDLINFIYRELNLGQFSNTKNLIDNFSVNKAHIDGSVPNIVSADVGVGLNNVSIPIEANIGYAGIKITLDNNQLLDVAVNSGLSVKTISNQLEMDLNNTVKFIEDDAGRADVAVLANNLYQGSAISNSIGAVGIIFGSDSSPENIIDTLAKVAASFDLSSLVNQLKGPVSTFTGKLGVQFEKLTYDILDPITMAFDLGVSLKGIASDFKLNIPYVHTEALFNNKDFVHAKLFNMYATNEMLTVNANISYTSQPDTAAAIIAAVDEILFHTDFSFSETLTVQSIEFGANPRSVIKTLADASISQDLFKPVDWIWTFFEDNKPFDFKYINAVLVKQGVDVDIQSVTPPFNLAFLLSAIEIQMAYQVDGTGFFYDAFDITIDIFKLPYIHLMAIPNMDPKVGIVRPMADCLLRILNFQSFSENARLTKLVMVGSNGARLDLFGSGTIHGRPLYFIPPINVDILAHWPFNGQGIDLPIQIDVGFLNPTIVHIDVGRIFVDLNNGGGDTLLTFKTNDDGLVILNKPDGGNETSMAGPPNIGIFVIEFPWKDLNPVTLVNTIIDLIDGKGFYPHIHFERGNDQIEWFNQILSQFASEGLLSQLVPLIGYIISHLKLELFGIDLEKVPIVGTLYDKAKEWAANHLPGGIQQHLQINGH